eukprot:CAMPEP_0182418724 /NCGR_PEP_ID=MMETSP1167-20130531/3096_1 /TAXON_ID=2988 /ORGANISM="Mallomonas Sp, Strain CCMP3275" /LENGTH=515 /DNA_ID=CAMNT_0024593063 /DNA_START=322 /DNA_END=1869 /DNA_ORIENTATION=-
MNKAYAKASRNETENNRIQSARPLTTPLQSSNFQKHISTPHNKTNANTNNGVLTATEIANNNNRPHLQTSTLLPTEYPNFGTNPLFPRAATPSTPSILPSTSPIVTPSSDASLSLSHPSSLSLSLKSLPKIEITTQNGNSLSSIYKFKKEDLWAKLIKQKLLDEEKKEQERVKNYRSTAVDYRRQLQDEIRDKTLEREREKERKRASSSSGGSLIFEDDPRRSSYPSVNRMKVKEAFVTRERERNERDDADGEREREKTRPIHRETERERERAQMKLSKRELKYEKARNDQINILKTAEEIREKQKQERIQMQMDKEKYNKRLLSDIEIHQQKRERERERILQQEKEETEWLKAKNDEEEQLRTLSRKKREVIIRVEEGKSCVDREREKEKYVKQLVGAESTFDRLLGQEDKEIDHTLHVPDSVTETVLKLQKEQAEKLKHEQELERAAIAQQARKAKEEEDRKIEAEKAAREAYLASIQIQLGQNKNMSLVKLKESMNDRELALNSSLLRKIEQ